MTFVGRVDSNVLAFSNVQMCGPFIGFKVGKPTIAIEFKFGNDLLTFLDKEIYSNLFTLTGTKARNLGL